MRQLCSLWKTTLVYLVFIEDNLSCMSVTQQELNNHGNEFNDIPQLLFISV